MDLVTLIAWVGFGFTVFQLIRTKGRVAVWWLLLIVWIVLLGDSLFDLIDSL